MCSRDLEAQNTLSKDEYNYSMIPTKNHRPLRREHAIIVKI
jgi:hypothetical protein